MHLLKSRVHMDFRKKHLREDVVHHATCHARGIGLAGTDRMVVSSCHSRVVAPTDPSGMAQTRRTVVNRLKLEAIMAYDGRNAGKHAKKFPTHGSTNKTRA